MKRILLLLLITAHCCAWAQPQDQLKVDVHPGIELFTIVQILANKYPGPNPSAYASEVRKYFASWKDHPAVKKVASFDKVYPDLAELGWCMSGFPDIQVYEPAELSWYKYYGKENVLEYIRLCRDFFNDTHFWDFFQQHSARYAAWGEALKASVDSAGLVQKLQGFYRYQADAHWWVCIDPLNSWGSHAIMTKTLNPPFSGWVAYNTGFFNSKADSTKDPWFEFTNFDYLVFHEGSHVYINHLMTQYAAQIDQLAYLFNKNDEGMKRNNIGNWTYCFDENLVRAITAVLYRKYRDQRSFKKQLAKELLSDFIYVEELEPFIYDQYFSSNKYKDFAAFFPRILQFLKEKHPQKVVVK
jgi:hypothetical protein